MKNNRHIGFWYGFNTTAIILTVGFILLVPFVNAFEHFSKTVDIYLNSQESMATVHTRVFTVDIANGSSTPLNAIEFELLYNPLEMIITDIVPTSALCEERFVLTKYIDNETGNALFQCGTITPFSSATGTLASVYATTQNINTPSVLFGTNTHVLAHDGYGTDVTRSTQRGPQTTN